MRTTKSELTALGLIPFHQLIGSILSAASIKHVLMYGAYLAWNVISLAMKAEFLYIRNLFTIIV